MNTNRERVLSIIAAHGSDSSGLIAILQDVQAAYNYLSEENLTLIADTLGISISKVYSVVLARGQGKAHHQGLRGHGVPCAQVRPDL